MPTFDFQCAKCKNVFEFVRPFGSKTVPSCPECGSKKTEKLMTPPAVHFKGSGWYKTDSRKPSKAPSSAPKKDDAKSGDIKPASPETKTGETKTPEKTTSAETEPVPSRAEGLSPRTKNPPDKKS